MIYISIAILLACIIVLAFGLLFAQEKRDQYFVLAAERLDKLCTAVNKIKVLKDQVADLKKENDRLEQQNTIILNALEDFQEATETV